MCALRPCALVTCSTTSGWLSSFPWPVRPAPGSPSRRLGAMPSSAPASPQFMLLIENEKYFDDTIAFAKQIGFYEPTSETGNGNHYLKNRLDYLRRVAQASRPWRARARRETGERPGSVGWQAQIPLSLDVGQTLGERQTGGGHGATCRALDRGRGQAATGGSRERRSAPRTRAMDAGSVTTARTVMRPAHPVHRVTSTSKVRRKRVAQSTRESGA